MSTLLLTGGTGFVGTHLRSTLANERVVVLGRRKPLLRPGEQWTYTDLAEAVAPEQLGEGEILCHLAYSMEDGQQNVAYNRHLLDAVNACPKIKHVVFMSSTSVYGAVTSPNVDEETPCRPVGEYAQTKLACEMVWRDGLREDCGLTVLRPSAVVGTGGLGLLSLIRDALHRPVVAAVKRSILHHRFLQHVAVSNVAGAVDFCLQRSPSSEREIYIVADENKSYAQMQDLVRRTAGRSPLPGLAMPRTALRVLGSVLGKPLALEQVFSSQKIRDAGFKGVVTLDEEVRRLVRAVERLV